MPAKVRSNRRHRSNSFQGQNQIQSLDTYFPANASPMKTVPQSGRNNKVLNANSSGYNTSGGTASANVGGGSYPRSLFRRGRNKSLSAQGIGYGAGVVFWGTDKDNWWAAVTDVENSQSYDTTYGSSCNGYSCSAYYITGYWSNGYVQYNYYRMTNSYRYGRYYACQSYSCSAYYSYSNNVNFRYNGSLKILRSIANVVSVVGSATWNYTQLDRVDVTVNDDTSSATIRGYNGGVERVNTSVSGGSGLITGVLGFNTTNGGYQGNIRLTRFTVS